MALALAALLAAPADSLAPCPGGQVLARADLEAAGATHLHDVFRLLDALDAITVDGFDAGPLGAWGPPGGALRVLVDGAPLASGTAVEPAGLEALPVAFGEVERAVFCPGPGLAGGRWGGPWLEIETAPPARRAYGSVDYTNETGDPGPARYLDPTLPNVDHGGPDFEAALVAQRGAGAAWAALGDRGYFPTDTALAPRVFEAVVPGQFPARSGTAFAAAARFPDLRLRAGGYRGIDLPFVPEVSREVPVSRRAVQGAAAGAGRLGPVGVRGHVHAARLRLRQPTWSALGTDPDWTETRLDAAVSLSPPGGAFAAGAQAERTEARGPRGASAVGIARVWTRLGWQRGRRSATVTAQATAATGGLGGALALVGRPLAGPGGLTLTLAAHRAPAAATPDAAFWARRGAAAFPGAGPVLLPGDGPPTDRALARLDASGRVGDVRLGAWLEGEGARGGVRLARLVLAGAAAGGEVHHVQAEGTAARAGVAAAWARGGLRLRASGRVQGAVGGDGPFREAWRRRPRAGAVAEATVRPDGRLALWARAEARAGATWTGYPRPDVPGGLFVDLGLSKRAWGDRLRVSLSGRNVLGAEERTHPLGAVLAPRLLVRLDARW
jgi:hypothetical protein